MSSCFDFVTNEEKKFVKQADRNTFDFDLYLHNAYVKLEGNKSPTKWISLSNPLSALHKYATSGSWINRIPVAMQNSRALLSQLTVTPNPHDGISGCLFIDPIA